MDKEKEENILRRKIFGQQRRMTAKKEKKDKIWRRKILFVGKENIWSAEEKKSKEGKGGKYLVSRGE